MKPVVSCGVFSLPLPLLRLSGGFSVGRGGLEGSNGATQRKARRRRILGFHQLRKGGRGQGEKCRVPKRGLHCLKPPELLPVRIISSGGPVICLVLSAGKRAALEISTFSSPEASQEIKSRKEQPACPLQCVTNGGLFVTGGSFPVL